MVVAHGSNESISFCLIGANRSKYTITCKNGILIEDAGLYAARIYSYGVLDVRHSSSFGFSKYNSLYHCVNILYESTDLPLNDNTPSA